jgi:hypothetical protein
MPIDSKYWLCYTAGLGVVEKKKNSFALHLWGIEPKFLGRLAHSLVVMAIEPPKSPYLAIYLNIYQM